MDTNYFNRWAEMATWICFLFLGLAFLSVWIRRDPKVWMSLLFASLIAALAGGNILPIGLLVVFGWALLWFFYSEGQQKILFIVIVLLSFGVVFHLFPGFNPVVITQKLRIGIQKAMILGLFPLALLVPVAVSGRDWTRVGKGLLFGCLGIAIMAALATVAGAVKWQMKIPSWIWIVNNLIFVAIPEEAFFRGFIQNQLAKYWNNRALALLVTSVIFTLAHVYWSPNGITLAFVFIASLLYGGVYLWSGKIESAILTHFLLNLIHITFFTYHAL